jgi:hypothetical protein
MQTALRPKSFLSIVVEERTFQQDLSEMAIFDLSSKKAGGIVGHCQMEGFR